MDINGSSSISPREFLTQAEQKYGKTAGLLIKAVLGFGLAGLAYLAFPAIIAFLTMATVAVGKAIVLGSMLVVIWGLYMFLSNPSVRAMIHDQWDGMIRSITKGAIPINAIDRVEAYADEYLEAKLGLVQATKKFIRAEANRHKEQLDQKNAELGDLVHKATFRKGRSCHGDRWDTGTQGQEDREEFRLLSEQITELRESIARLERMGTRYELFMTLITKYERAFSLSIRKIRNTVKLVVDEYQATERLSAATEAMSGVMEGTDSRTKIFDATMAYLVDQVGNNVATIEEFFDRTRSIIANTDLQGDLAEDRLMHEINEMDQRTDAAITTLESHDSSAMHDIVARARDTSDSVTQNRTTAGMPSGDGKYDDLLKRFRKQ